jgi:hypothetical protein
VELLRDRKGESFSSLLHATAAFTCAGLAAIVDPTCAADQPGFQLILTSAKSRMWSQ